MKLDSGGDSRRYLRWSHDFRTYLGRNCRDLEHNLSLAQPPWRDRRILMRLMGSQSFHHVGADDEGTNYCRAYRRSEHAEKFEYNER